MPPPCPWDSLKPFNTNLLVEDGRLETERVDNVVDLLGTGLKGLSLLLSRGVAT
jgi:hypothetical protein